VPGGSQTIDYTLLNLPKSVTLGSGDVTTFDYDASGRRVARHDGQGDTSYIPDLYERRTMTSTPGTVEHVYRIYAGEREMAQVQRVEQGGVITSTKTLYLHDDALGSPNVISDESGHALAVQRFSPFGKNENASAATGVQVGFTGHQ